MLNPARLNRLRLQEERLLRLSERSDLIQVEPVEVLPNWPAEKYLVTYHCRSIVGIQPDLAPIYGEAHQMELYLTADYPNAEPSLKFLTPIWHPNISSQPPRKVCTDRTQSWWVGKDLDDLVIYICELVQYKHYHAKWEQPFPQDREVAEWVLNYAEPRQIVSLQRPLDARPPRKGYQIVRCAQPEQAPPTAPAKAPSRIQLGARVHHNQPQQQHPLTAIRRITLGSTRQ